MPGTIRILIVDDEKLIRMSFRTVLQKEGYAVLEADCGRTALERLSEDDIDLVLLDYRLPDIDGLEVLRQARQAHPGLGVILITAYSSIDNAVEAIKLGAYDYLNKPVSNDDLLATVAKALETTQLRRELQRIRSEQKRVYGPANIVGRSRSIERVFDLIQKIASSSAGTVLLQGESGTGKDLVAKAIHYASDRADQPFVNITCSALPETLLESELFGHERGAFTDAKQLKKGLVELADRGTVFLDEIGEMGPSLQAKLLRFLEEKTFKRVGGTRDLTVDVRVIAATNIDLEHAVRTGGFREDLYYRLKVVPIDLPPLRDRRDDIPLLVAHFVDQFNREMRRNTERFTDGALRSLQRYRWPGNVRELRNVVERVMILEAKPEIGVADLPEEILAVENGDAMTDAPTAAVAGPHGGGFLLPEDGISLKELERDMVRQALERTGGNQSQAARLLRISRDTLRYKMHKYELS